MRAILDTSFFVATEAGRPLGKMEGVTKTEVSVVTLAELTVGVLIANDDDRPTRVATLAAVESMWDPLPVDTEVAREFARIAAALRVGGRRVAILDALKSTSGSGHWPPTMPPQSGPISPPRSPSSQHSWRPIPASSRTIRPIRGDQPACFTAFSALMG